LTVVFRGEQLFLPTTLVETFKLLDVRIRYWSYLIDPEPPTPRVHDDRLSSLRLPMDASAPGEDISVTIENMTDEPLVFMAMLVGAAAR